MSDLLLKAVGGAVTDHGFRDALFDDFNATLTRYAMNDHEATQRLAKFVNGPDRAKVRQLLTQLEPYICGPKLENCFRVKVPKKPKVTPKKSAKKKKI